MKNLAYHINFAHISAAWDERITHLGMTRASIGSDGKIDPLDTADNVVMSNVPTMRADGLTTYQRQCTYGDAL